MAKLSFISGGIFYLGTLCLMYPPKKLNLCLIIGASMLLYSVFLNSGLWPLLVLLYLLLIFNSLSDDFKSEGRSFFTLGVCALVSVLVILLSGMYGIFTNDSPSTFALTIMQIFKSFDGVAISSGFAKISRTLVKCFFSPFLVLIPIAIFTPLLKEVHTTKYSSWLLSLPFVMLVYFFVEIPNLLNGIYSNLFPVVMISCLLTALGIHEILRWRKDLYLRVLIIVFIPVVLAGSLFARTYRDYYRPQSMMGVISELSRAEIPLGAVVYTPYGQNLSIKSFGKIRKKKHLVVKAIPHHLRESDVDQLIADNDSVYLFIDDYFIYEQYWQGQFWRRPFTVTDKISIKTVKVFGEGSPNEGRLVKISRR